MVPIAHGNDGGGSIRIPAACCGLVGLKAARGRISSGPDAGQSFLVSDGVLTSTVADTAAVLDLMAGYETGDSNWAPPPPGSYAELAAREPGPLKLGLALNVPLDGSTLDPVCERAARDCAQLLRSLGHRVDEFEPPWSGLGLLPVFTSAFGAGISMTTMIGARLAGREPTRGRRRAADLGDVEARQRGELAEDDGRAGEIGRGRPVGRRVRWPPMTRC